MYCTKCGAPIPEGSDVCPQCTQTKTMPDGEVFQFHYESGMSSRSTTAIDHTITLQRDEMVVTREKSVTIFHKKTYPSVTRKVPYQEVKQLRAKTGLAPVEIPIILVCLILMLASSQLIYTILWLAVSALSVKLAVRTMIHIQLTSGPDIKVPYSGEKTEAAKFVERVQQIIR